jgi:decaprenyl-phosphate phosphoribosyltransferase
VRATSYVAARPEAPRARSVVGDGRVALRAVRPRQWTKNALVFAGLLFAGKVGSLAGWLEAATAFLAFCALSGAAYIVNDIRDREADRLHPVKRTRPLASGALTAQSGLALAGALAVGGAVCAGLLGALPLALAASFLGLQLAYSAWLKRLPYADLLAIAGLFVVRAAAGATAVRVHVSPWLLLCTALLALFLGLAKRRGELVLVESGRTPGRRALAGYSLASIDRQIDVTAAVAIGVYLVYAATAHDSWELLLTVPFVAAGVLRYRHLVRRHGLGEEPENVLLRDLPIVLTVVAWAALAATVLATT